MKTELLGQERNVVKIKLELDAEEFSKAVERTVKDISQRMPFHGFRKGHVPRKIVEMRMGLDDIHAEAIEKLLPDNVRQIVEDYELDTIDTPQLYKIDDIVEGQPVTCELSFEIMPEVKLPDDLDDIEVERVRAVVTDDMVQQLIDRILKDRATLEVVDRSIEARDVVDIKLRTLVLEEGARRRGPYDQKIDLFDDTGRTVRPELREALVGHTVGETVEAEFDVEPDRRDALAGKRIRYIMAIKGISTYVLPELGETFYKALYGEETDVLTEDAFRARLRDDLMKSMEAEREDEATARALDAIASRTELELPFTLVSRQMSELRRRDEDEAQARFGAPLEIVFRWADDPKRKVGYDTLLKDRAEAIVRRSLVIDALAKKYDVGVEKEDVEAEIDKRSARHGVDRDKFMAYVYRNEDARSSLFNDTFYGKVMGVMMSKIKVKDVDELSSPVVATDAQGEEA